MSMSVRHRPAQSASSLAAELCVVGADSQKSSNCRPLDAASTGQYSYVVSAFQLVYSFSQPVAGYLTDLIGPRVGYAVAAVTWGVAAAAHGLATGWLSMAGFRAVLGLSEAVAIPTGTKVSTIWFPSQERSIATGWFNSGSSIGSMITPPLVIWLASVYGWRPAFLITGTLGVLLGIVWFWLYRDPEAHPDLSADERAYITSGREPPAGAKPSFGAILSKTKFLGIIIARFLTEPAWQTFAFWIPLYMVSVRGMDIKQFALFAWLPFLFSDIGCIFGGLSRADPSQPLPAPDCERAAHRDHDRRVLHGRD